MKLMHLGGGHPRNVEFIVRACKLYNIEYHSTHNPQFTDNAYDIIWSPCQWIDPDRYPHSKILFGPHFFVFPDASNPLFTKATPEHAKRCVYLCLSDWNIRVHSEFIPKEKQIIPFVAFPFGVENIPIKTTTDYTYDCILYFKGRHPSLLDYCESVVKAHGLRYKIYRYGSYQRQEYIDTLKQSRFAIWIGSHESQGFGFQECLATGTPMYVYDVKSMKDEFAGGKFIYTHHSEALAATSAPYWSDTCGIKVYSNEEFISRLDEFLAAIPTYDPAAFVQSVLTDRICFQRFLDVLNIKTN